MKKLTGALVLSLSLLMTSACRSAGETRDAEDASTPDAQTEPQGLQSDAGPQGDAGTGSATVSPTPSQGMAAGSGGTTPDTGTQAGNPSAGSSYAATLSPAEKQAQEACVDKWLKGKKLDRYGHDEGTMYAGGSPIFNEMTGEARERLDYVYERKPEAKKACVTSAQSAPENKKGIPEKKK